MEVITDKKEIYESGDVFYKSRADRYYLLEGYDEQWQLVSLDGDASNDYTGYGNNRESIKAWVASCLTDYTRYPKSDYQLILHKKGAE